MNNPELDEPIQSSTRKIKDQLQSELYNCSSPSSASQAPQQSTPTPSLAFSRELRHSSFGSHAYNYDPGHYCQPKRWWLTSTTFPLIAGTFGPISNLFSVCALVQTWRVQYDTDAQGSKTNEKRVSDPTWLIAVNAVSLVFALAANVLLNLNFAHRVKYKVAQPLTIVFWYISCFTLLGLVIATRAHLVLYPQEEYAFSQSFYYGIISAIIYFIISTLLWWNLLGAYYYKKYPASFTSLTVSQRTLMLQTISYSCYLALGAGIFSAVEGWEYVDGIYFADYTLLTIGLGSDFPLKTATSQALLIPYAVIGIIMIGLVIGSIRSFFLEHGKVKVQRRALHKKRIKAETIEQRERRRSMKEGFEAMRNVQEKAARGNKWWGLFWSFIAFLIVWLGGASVFMVTEKAQNWNFFQSLYFTYTSILTIGYGDFYPQSNAGKPFFVIWSLIAVPTVTILISSMNDTIIGWVKEGTLWLGRKTILPERKSHRRPWQSQKTVEREVKRGENGEEDARNDDEEAQEVEVERVSNRNTSASSSPSLPTTVKTKQPHLEHTRDEDYAAPQPVPPSTHFRITSHRHHHHHHGSNKTGVKDPSFRCNLASLGSPNETTTTGDQREIEIMQHNNPQASSTHTLTARIIREMKRLTQDVGHKPTKKYEWEEWKLWLELLGDEDEETAEWRWLGDHGPLLSGVSETEWVLGKLYERLEELLGNSDM